MTDKVRQSLTTSPSQSARFVIRKESVGAVAFDTLERRVFRLDQDTLAQLSRPDGRQHDSGRSESVRRYFDKADRPLYHVLNPLQNLRVPPALHAMVAPNRIYLELTRKCLQRCEACYNAAGAPLPDELDGAEWSALIDHLAEAGVFEFRFTGGEPTCSRHFLELLDRALATRRYVSVGTCGLMPPAVLEAIAVRPLDEIIVSYHGPAEVHDAFTGKHGSHARTLRTLRFLRSAGRRVRLNVTLTRRTFPTVENAFALADELEIETINLIHARPVGRGRDHNACMTPADNYQHNLRLAEFRGGYRVKVMTDFDLLRPSDHQPARHAITERVTSCPAGREFAFISPEGYVFPCGVAPVAHVSKMTTAERRLFLAGSVREQPFLEIWHASPTWVPYRDLALCKPDDCRQCNFWGTKCYGSCPPAAYVATGSLAGRDPCCFQHLLTRQS